MAKLQPKQQQLQNEPKRKIGQGMAASAFRQGAKELANITDAFPQGTPTVDEPGTMFNTPITGISQQTGFAQPVKSTVDLHHSQMVGNAPSVQQDKTVTAPQQQADLTHSIIDQHHGQMVGNAPGMEQQRDMQQPSMEIEQ